MLSRLTVSNIALIEDARIDLGPGLTVLSGETGAGKTALLSALKLLVGERADSSALRDGADAAVVEGTFVTDSGSLEVRRRLDRSGRSRCWVDGASVNVAELARLVGPLVDLHGQHEHQTLLDPASHARFLDAWIGEEAASAQAAYTAAYLAQAEARRDLERLEAAQRSSREEREAARFTIADIEAVAPREGEYEELTEMLGPLQHAQDLAVLADTAYGSLYGDGGAVESLGTARDALGRGVEVDGRLEDLSARLEDLLADCSDLSADLRRYRDGLESDPVLLERHLDRLGQLDALCRTHGPRMQDVFERLERARTTVQLAEGSGDLVEKARSSLDAAEETLGAAAAHLADVHDRAADPFSRALGEAVASLGMEGASLIVSITDLPRPAWTAEGSQHIELLYAPGIAVSPRPLARIASGGELSRVMLALKGSMTAHGTYATLVFDEVDAGIGGTTAQLVARRLRELAVANQVIVVTHLPQIAALADRQFRVSKDSAALPRTTIREVVGEDRVSEVARMLSGRADELSLAHARELLSERTVASASRLGATATDGHPEADRA